ncbi:hypothetical protein ACJX0J_018572 [Zea mays]
MNHGPEILQFNPHNNRYKVPWGQQKKHRSSTPVFGHHGLMKKTGAQTMPNNFEEGTNLSIKNRSSILNVYNNSATTHVLASKSPFITNASLKAQNRQPLQ